MRILSTIVFNPDTTEKQQKLVAKITPLLSYTRDDWIETRDVSRPHKESDECTLYVIVHTGNIRTMVIDLEDNGIL